MPLHLKFEQTLELTYDFNKSVMRKNRPLRLVLIVIIAIVLLNFGIAFMNTSFSIEALLGWVLPIGIILGIWILLIPIIIKRQIKGSLKESTLGLEREMIISEEDIVLKTKASDSIFKWTAITKVNESRLSYFLYIAKNQALIVPKSCLTPETEAVFLNILREKHLSPGLA